MGINDDGLKLVNPDSGSVPLSDAARAEIALIATRQRKANGLLMGAINFVGGHVEDRMKQLPNAVRNQIEAAAGSALIQSYEAASRSRGGRLARMGQSDRMHRVLGTISGALGGMGGLPTALAELPVATTVIFRAVQSVAETYGEDPQSVEIRKECLAVFGAGGPLSDDDGVDTSFIATRLSLSGAALHKLIARIAPRFATVLSQKLTTQAVPVLGAAAGAGTNYAFVNYYVEVAHVHFGLRKLARDHGEEAVLDEFHRALTRIGPR